MSSRGKGNLVSCVFLLDGAKASCDVQVVMVRAPGAAKGWSAYVPNLFYNVAVPGERMRALHRGVLPVVFLPFSTRKV